MDIQDALIVLGAAVIVDKSAMVHEAWRTLKTAVLAQQQTTEQGTPCRFEKMHSFYLLGGQVVCGYCGVKL